MARVYSNYDGQARIPRQVVLDTSDDEALAQRLHAEAPPPPTDADEEVAREVQEGLGVVMETDAEGDIARRLQERTPLPDTCRDEGMVRRMQERNDRRRQNAALNDEAFARCNARADGSRGPGTWI
jgi:hypothetical protein